MLKTICKIIKTIIKAPFKLNPNFNMLRIRHLLPLPSNERAIKPLEVIRKFMNKRTKLMLEKRGHHFIKLKGLEREHFNYVNPFTISKKKVDTYKQFMLTIT